MSGINEQFKSAGKNLSRLLTKTTEVLNERWEELTAIQERRREIYELSRERQKLMAEMGAKVYSLHRRGRVQNQDLLSDCERIDGIGTDIERMEHEIEELKRAKSQAEVVTVEVEDDTPVVDDDEIEAEAAQPADEAEPEMIPVEAEEQEPIRAEPEGDPGEPEVIPDETARCAHAQAPVEGSVDDEDNAQRPGCDKD